MDITTFLGIGALAGMAALGAVTGQLPPFFLNWHGLAIVLGGTAGAMLINTPLADARGAAAALAVLFRGSRFPSNEGIVAAIVELAERVHGRGVSALQEVDAHAVGGFLGRAAGVAVEYNNPDLVWQILETEINASYDRNNEMANVYRTMGILAPMFGLLGTLIGIVSVLREISNPEKVGGSMAIAMTTAFYGIALANTFCVPVAGKLRSRNIEELRAKTMVAEGVVMMLRGTVPLIIERKLRSYR